jgi:ABC-2 type transport system ATP-binding protein
MDKADIIAYRKKEHQIDVLVRDKTIAQRKYQGIVVDDVSVDEITLLLVKGERV